MNESFAPLPCFSLWSKYGCTLSSKVLFSSLEWHYCLWNFTQNKPAVRAVQLQANVSFRTGCVYYWRWPNYKWPTLYTLLQISRPGSWCIEHLSALAPFWTTAPRDLAQRWCVNRGKNPCSASCSMATWQLPCKHDHGRTFKCCGWIITIVLSWMNTKAFGWDHKPRSPRCVRMQKDHATHMHFIYCVVHVRVQWSMEAPK